MSTEPDWTWRLIGQQVQGPREVHGLTWENDLYIVWLRKMRAVPNWPRTVWLTVHPKNDQPVHSWPDLQRIKNELVGPESEGFELYPAESRLCDEAHNYHLWVFEDTACRMPVGFPLRSVVPHKCADAQND